MGKRKEHYKLGWEEKKKSGNFLVKQDIKHQYNLPKGKDYDYNCKGLLDIDD